MKKVFQKNKLFTQHHFWNKNGAGFTLLEVLVALSVLIMGLLASVSLLTKTSSLNTVISDRLIASHLAQEGIELVRNLISNNILAGKIWNSGLSANDDGYQIDYNDGRLYDFNERPFQPLKFDGSLYSYDSGQPTKFKRKIRIFYENNDEMVVQSIVTWQSHRIKGDITLTVEDHFYRE